MVQFGTSGWRGIIGATSPSARPGWLPAPSSRRARGDTPPQLILVGYDTRMLSEKFARTAAKLIAGCRVRAELPPRDIRRRSELGVLDGGPTPGSPSRQSQPPEYSGLKLYTREGFLAPRALTDRVERATASSSPTSTTSTFPTRTWWAASTPSRRTCAGSPS